MMTLLLNVPIFTVCQVLAGAALIFLTVQLYGATVLHHLKARFIGNHGKSPGRPQLNAIGNVKGASNLTIPRTTEQEKGQSAKLKLFKDLYYKVQNLERFPEILPQSRDLLLSLFAETLEEAHGLSEPGILAVEEYSHESLATFLLSENDRITHEWEQYMSRRRAGSPVEMFKDKKEAEWWLKQIAPVKYVDGAWLGHIHKITTPFTLRGVTKDAWQVLSEELGDGDPLKNHVHVYRDLMRNIGAKLPEGDSEDFVHPRHNLNEISVWKAALAQLLISLFPHEFLPEILGFNMHFEALTIETIKAAREVEEMGLDPYYFVLHISIDNADSGHTAIAMQAVVKYIEQVQKSEGRAAADQAWKCVQAGYILSKGLSAGPVCPSMQTPATISFPRNIREAEVIRIFKAKAPVAHKIHCSSRMRIGGRRLDHWLEPQAFADKQWQMEFLDHLSNMRPWVRRGESSKSRLIQELSWEGKMFGSFTQREVEIVKRWIDELDDPNKVSTTNPQAYWSFTDRPATPSSSLLTSTLDPRVDYPVLLPALKAIDPLSPTLPPTSAFSPSPNLHTPPAVEPPTTLPLSTLLPLWFTNPCLLESFICIPAKTTTTVASAVVRLLRAQSGFDIEGPGVAGMDEARRVDSMGLVELGFEMVKRSGLPPPKSLKDVLERWPSDFAVQMLRLSMRPVENSGLLMGLAWAFVGMHDVLASSPSCTLLSAQSQAVLRETVRRERDCLEVCFKELKGNEEWCREFHRGFTLGWEEVGRCFGEDKRKGGGGGWEDGE